MNARSTEHGREPCSVASGRAAPAGSACSENRLVLGLALVACFALGGCALVDKPARPAVYDFGPGILSVPATGSAPTLAALALPDVEAGAALDSTAVLYRLNYADAQQLLPYAQARWSMTPAQLLRQRLRETLGQRRAVFTPGELSLSGTPPPLVLRVELEEFSQIFDAPQRSVGVVRLRATVVQARAGGDLLLGQRSFVMQRAAPSADARGGVRALTAATDSAVEEIEQWLNQLR